MWASLIHSDIILRGNYQRSNHVPVHRHGVRFGCYSIFSLMHVFCSPSAYP